jgi:PAS domain-containing protein
MHTELDRQIGELQQGEHLCSVYETSDEMLSQALPYLKHGLLNDEQCIYVADEHTSDTIANALKQGGIDVDRAISHGRLKFWTRREYRQPGAFNLGIMRRFVEQTLEEAVANGYSGIRLAVEMTWTVNSGVSDDELVRWEDLINQISFPGSQVSFLCQYNARLLQRDLVSMAVHVHPVVVLGQQICPNLYYLSAERVLEDPAKSTDLGSLLPRLRAENKIDKPASDDIGNGSSARRQTLQSFLAGGPMDIASSPQGNQPELSPLFAIVDKVLNLLPLGLYICEAPSAIVQYYNRWAEEVWGRRPVVGDPRERFCGAHKLYRCDGSPLPHELCPMADAIKKGVVVQNQELIVERPDGSRRTVLVNISPIRNHEGRLIGALNVVQDITERKRAEAARAQLVRDLERSKMELQEKIMDLQKFEDVVVGREIKMIELEKENRELKQRLAELDEIVS